MKHIVSFSGGKDSTALLLMMLERNMPVDDVIFIDTTKEFPAMYNHIKKVQSFIRPLEIHVVTINFDYWFSEVKKVRKADKVCAGYGWPSFHNRWCTGLKQEAFIKTVYTKNTYEAKERHTGEWTNKNIIEYHGLTCNEKSRVKTDKRRIIKYPLIQWSLTEKDTLKYCFSKGFDWDGLYKHLTRVSCYCCPLMNLKNLESVYQYYPKLWQKLKVMDKLSLRSFRDTCSLENLETRFFMRSDISVQTISQMKIF